MQEALWDPQRVLVASLSCSQKELFIPDYEKQARALSHGGEGEGGVVRRGGGGLILAIKMLMRYLRRQTFGFNEKESKMKRFLFKLPETWKMTAEASN